MHFLSFELDARRSRRSRAAYALDRANYQLAHFLGETWFNDGEPRRRCATSRACSSSSPDHYDCLVYSGVIHYELGDSARAEAFLDARRRGLSRRLPAAVLPGRDPRPARAAWSTPPSFLERAVAIESVPQAFYLLGSAYHDMGQRQLPGDPRAAQRDPPRSHLRGGAPPARALLPRPPLAAQGARRRSARRSASTRRRCATRPGGLPVGPLRAGRCRASRARPASGSSAPRRACRAGDTAEALRATGARCALEPDNPTVLMSHALACLQMNRSQESEAITAQGARPRIPARCSRRPPTPR